jgi:hypothetical protein
VKKTSSGKRISASPVRRKVGGKKAPSGKRRWTAQEVKLLKKLYPGNSHQDIARQLRRPLSGVIAQAFHLGLRKSSRRLATMGRENIQLRWGPRRKAARRRTRR